MVSDKISQSNNILVINMGGTINMKEENGMFVTVKDHMFNLINSELEKFNHIFYLDKNNQDLNKEEEVKFLSKITYKTGKFNNFSTSLYYLENDVLIDSVESNFSEIDIVFDKIQKNNTFDNIIILYGTDTVSHLSSALFFKLKMENLKKKIFFVTSGTPISKDPKEFVNFLNSIILIDVLTYNKKSLLKNYDFSDVFICYGRYLHFGINSSKISAKSLDSFHSKNQKKLPNITEKEENIEKVLDDFDKIKPFEIDNFDSFELKELNIKKNIGIFIFYPGNAHIKNSDLDVFDSIIILTYGSGSSPSKDKKLLEKINSFKRKIIILSQCCDSIIDSSYESGHEFLKNIDSDNIFIPQYLSLPGAISLLLFQ